MLLALVCVFFKVFAKTSVRDMFEYVCLEIKCCLCNPLFVSERSTFLHFPEEVFC